MSLLPRILPVLIAIVSAAAWGGGWPRFLGPDGTGVVETGEKIARSWPAGGPKELWKVPTGPGFGGPAISGQKVYLLDRKGEQDIFRVLDLKTGRMIWEQGYAAGRYQDGGYHGSRSTPTIDGDRAYTVGPSGHVCCFDVAARKPVWDKSLRSDFGAKPGGWGFAQSPLVVGDLVIVSASGGPNGLVALNKETGAVAWKTRAFGENDTYTSPMLVTIAGQEQIVMWHRGRLAAASPEGGAPLWEYRWDTNRPIPQPVHLGDGKFFLTIGYGGGCAMIHVSKAGSAWKVTEIFQDQRSGSKVPPALFYRGHIYTNAENGRGLQCLDAEGNVKWETGRRQQFGLGSLIIADGVIFIVHGDKGELVMAEANPAGYKELGRAKVLGGNDIWAPLALSEGMLVLRDQSQMKCLLVGVERSASAGK
jgi:outer membrane protein assembly factor BamB